MSERNESTRICKCCGIERSINDYDINNNGRPISLCRKCRRAQQTISNLHNYVELSTTQQEKLSNATQWLELCKQKTGYVSGSRARRDRIAFDDPNEIAEMQRAIAEQASKGNKEVL